MKIEPLHNGLVRITPDKGKRLLNTISHRYYSDAVVVEEQVKNFIEVI